MDNVRIEALFSSLIDKLAAIEHERWSHWQRYVHERGKRMPDGSLVLPADLVARWDRQIETRYELLTEQEKESDREQARRYIPIIASALSRTER